MTRTEQDSNDAGNINNDAKSGESSKGVDDSLSSLPPSSQMNEQQKTNGKDNENWIDANNAATTSSANATIEGDPNIANGQKTDDNFKDDGPPPPSLSETKQKETSVATTAAEAAPNDAPTTTSTTAKESATTKEEVGDGSNDANGNNNKTTSTESPPPASSTTAPVVSLTKRTRPPYKYDPQKLTLRFLFANKDGLTITVPNCDPNDTVGHVKDQLLSVWPKDDLPQCSQDSGNKNNGGGAGGRDQLRLICMGKGILSPDTKTLEECQIPVFKTHPTPVNVSVRPQHLLKAASKSGGHLGKDGNGNNHGNSGGGRLSLSVGVASGRSSDETGQGCGCVIQ